LVQVYSIAVAKHAPRGQKLKGQRHTVTKTVTVARLLVILQPICCLLCYLQPLPTWVCMSIRLPIFS